MNIRNGTKRISATGLLSRASILALGVAVSTPALAQDAEEAAPEEAQRGGVLMQEIVVTANKRQEKLQDVGISATAFSGAALNQLGITNTTELTKITPSLNINYAQPSVASLSIRGVSQNDFADHLETPIAVYWDEGYVGTSGAVAVPVFDMDRVEILRGPQGTLFGRNARGGLMHFISAAPTDHYTGYFEASYGRFDTWNIQGAVSGPLTEGLRARVAFTRNKSDGPFTNVVTGKHDVNNTDNWAIRGRLQADLGEAATLDLIGAYYRDDQGGVVWPLQITVPGDNGLGRFVGDNEIASWPNIILGGTIDGACPGCNQFGFKDADGSPWTIASTWPGFYKRSITKGQAKLTHEFGDTTFTSISDYMKVSKDTSYGTSSMNTHFFIYGAALDYEQFSQELRLNGDTGKLKWVAGLYYLNMRGFYTQPLDLDISIYVGAPLLQDGVFSVDDSNVPVHFEPQYSIDVDSYAVFAQGEYELSPQLSATLGLRYTYDKKTNDYGWSDVAPYTPVIFYEDKQTFENVAIKAQLDWRPSDGTLVYLGYTRSHKGGNWAAPAFPPFDPADFPHDQEVLTSYETGVKTALFDRMMTLNLSAFYYDYKDYQAFSLQGLGQSIFNKDAEVYGLCGFHPHPASKWR